MWNNASLLNGVAGFLVALALLVFGFAGVQLLLRSPLFPLREVTVIASDDDTVLLSAANPAGGIAAGERIVIAGVHSLTSGQVVKGTT